MLAAHYPFLDVFWTMLVLLWISVASSSGAAGEIERAKGLLDAGAINQGSSTRSRPRRSRSAERS